MNKAQSTLLSVAVSGLFLGAAAGCASTPKDSAASMSMPAGIEKHACKGQNSCKHQGGCKTEHNDCAGKNSCKHKGGCKTDMASCKAHSDCKGTKNECKG